MSTRGAFGFVLNGEEKITYNHSDIYPAGLGVDVLNWLTSADLDAVRQQVATLRVVSEATPPTPEDVERLLPLANPTVSTGALTEWYVLLRETQGDPAAILTAGVMVDGRDFPLDSLFCEWAYVVDLDAGTFEVYEGFQKAPHSEGRFATRHLQPAHRDERYSPVRLVASWPLTAPPTTAQLVALEDGDDE